MSKIVFAIGFIVILVIAVFAGEQEDLNRGKKLYIQQCSKCHRKNGKGVKLVYPPLRNSDYVQKGDLVELLRGMLYGREGKIVVNGKTYKGVMTTEIDKSVSDEEILLILNYILKEMNGMEQQATAEDLELARKKGKLPVYK